MKSFQSRRGTSKKNLSNEYGFPSGTRLMRILRIHLKIYSPECVIRTNPVQKCVSCAAEVKTREHFLLRCPALESEQQGKLEEIAEAFLSTFKFPFTTLPTSQQLHVIIDPSLLTIQGDTNISCTPSDLVQLEATSRAFSASDSTQAGTSFIHRSPKEKESPSKENQGAAKLRPKRHIKCCYINSSSSSMVACNHRHSKKFNQAITKPMSNANQKNQVGTVLNAKIHLNKTYHSHVISERAFDNYCDLDLTL